MGCGKQNDEDNPPAPLKEYDDIALTIRESGVSDCAQISPGTNSFADDFTFPYVSLPNSPWENVHGTYHSYTREPGTGNNQTGFMWPGTTQNAQSLIELRGTSGEKDICASGFQDPQVPMRFMPTQNSSIAGGYQINGQEADALVHGNRSQIAERSLSCSASMSERTRETGVSHDVNFSAFHPGKIDGSFLTLGIGNNAESKTKTKFCSREIATKLENSISPQSSTSHAPQRIASVSSVSHNSASNFPGFQSNPGGFPSPMCDFVGWTSSWNDVRTVQSTVGLSSNSVQNPGIPETFKQYDFFENNDSNSGFGGASNERNLGLNSYNGCQTDLPSSLPFSSTNPCFSYLGFTELSELASESAKPVWTTTQSTAEQQQNHLTRNGRDAFPPFASHPMSLQGSSITQDYLGILIPHVEGNTPQALESGPSVCAQPVDPVSSSFEVNSAQPPGNSPFPGQIRPQIAEGCAMKTATGSPFPTRLGVQLDDVPAPQSANFSVFPRVMAVQTRSNEQQPQNFNPVQHTQNLLGQPSNLGHREANLQPQFNPAFPTVNKPPQVSNITSRTSLKRRASELYPVPSWGHRKKLVHVSNNHHSMIHPKQGSPATRPLPAPPSPPPFHIKQQGFDERPQPTGQKCLLCKRDLSFAPEGPIHQPINPPAVAVLHCGHTFHDHCLLLITPEDQIKDPPCIPCAVGET